MKIKPVFFFVFLIADFISSAQIEIQPVIRPRFEFRNGYGTLRNDSTTPAAFVSQRTRLNFLFIKDKTETKISVFDFRVWGDQVWKKDIASVGLNEAWVKIKINNLWSVKFGRQQLKYDNSRLISPVNWNQIGASHDALKISFKDKTLSAELISALNQSSQNKFGTDYVFRDSFYKTLNIFYLNRKFNNFSLASLNIADGFQDENNPEKLHFRFTYGIIPSYKNEKFKITGRAFLQTGKLQTGQNINAFYTNLDFTYKISDKLKITVGNEVKSGNNASDSTNITNNAFDILYGARHKFNGRIDYFNIPSTTGGAGLTDSYLKAQIKINQKFDLYAEYHYFTLQNNYIAEGNIIDKSLGQETDFILRHKFSKDINFETGYSVIFGTESLEIIKNGNKNLFNNWFYFTVTVNPAFLLNKNE